MARFCRVGRPLQHHLVAATAAMPRAQPGRARSRMSGSSCAITGCRTASSNPTTTSSTTAASPGTTSSISRGASCPSACASGHMGHDQCALVLIAGHAFVWLLCGRPTLLVQCKYSAKRRALPVCYLPYFRSAGEQVRLLKKSHNFGHSYLTVQR